MSYAEDMNQVWQMVVERFRQEMKDSSSTWNLWIADVKCIDYDDVNKIVTLACYNGLKVSVFRSKYLEKATAYLIELLGFDVTVNAVVDPNHKTPVLLPDEDEEPEEPKKSVAAAMGNEINPYNFKYTFDNFITGSTNKFAHAACLAVADHPGDSYNPLYIYGPSGLGKTHLLRAIINELMNKKPGLKAVYVKSEDFLNEMVDALAKKKMNEFHNKYRKCDVLLMDDIQFIDGKEATQDEFFHTFNTLADNRKQVILTSDRPPKDINQLADRLRSRFECGLIADIQPPNLELRIAIIKNKADQIQIKVPEDVLNYLAENLMSNIRQIEGAITKLSALSMVSGEPISIDMAKNCIMELLGGAEPVNVTIDKIFKVVEKRFGVTKDAMLGEKQSKDVALPRHYAVYLISKITSMSFPNIAKLFNRDHSTIHSSFNLIDKKVKLEPEVSVEITAMLDEVKNITI